VLLGTSRKCAQPWILAMVLVGGVFGDKFTLLAASERDFGRCARNNHRSLSDLAAAETPIQHTTPPQSRLYDSTELCPVISCCSPLPRFGV
jgi:hypothetical protein